MHKVLIFTIMTAFALLAPTPRAAAQTAVAGADVRFHNEQADTTRLTDILINESAHRDAPRVSRIARQFVGTPYRAGTLDEDYAIGTIANPFGNDDTGIPPVEEVLTVNLDEMDCTTFVETVLALAYTVGEGRQSWQDFVYNLRRLRYRGGETDGYASRLHYPSAWVVDNAARGLLRETTGDHSSARYSVKTLDFMSRHRDQYPALTDSANFARIRSMEAGYSNYRYPYLKANSLKEKEMPALVRDGDVVLVTSPQKDLDVVHMGIAVTGADGRPHLVHASSREGRVIEDPLPLFDYLRRNRSDGIRLVRLRLD